MIQASLRVGESQPHRRVSVSVIFTGYEKRRRQVPEKYNAHLSSLKLPVDEGRVILVIIREERKKEDEEGNEDSHLAMQSHRVAR